MINNIAAVLWDLDGTLADTGSTHYQAWYETFSALNISFSINSQKATFGMNAAGIIEYHFGYLPRERELRKLIDKKEKLFRKLAQGNIKLFPQSNTWLSFFRDKGIKQVIASSAPLLNIESLVIELCIENYFINLVSGDELPPKPSPEIFLTAAESINITANHCLVIEDSTSGIKAAKEAGMKCLAVTFTHDQGSLGEADLIINGYEENPRDKFSLLNNII